MNRTSRTYSQYYVPRTKAGLLKELLPVWKGSRTELREMSVKTLSGIFHTTRINTINKLMTRKESK